MSFVLLLAATFLGLPLFVVVVTSCFNALDRGVPVRPTRAGAVWFLREWAAWVRTLLAHPSGFFARAPERRPPAFPAEPRIPVVLVPGFALNQSSMGAIARHLRLCGWDWVHVINNEPWESTVEGYARGLAEAVEALRQASGAQQVDLIAHSMGGLISGLFINEMGGDAVVRRLVTLGTPWHGTRMHVFGRRRQVRDLAPESPVLERARPPAVPLTSVWSTHDHLVWPARSAIVPGAHEVRFTHVGHLDLLYANRVHVAVAEALAAPATPRLPDRDAPDPGTDASPTPDQIAHPDPAAS